MIRNIVSTTLAALATLTIITTSASAHEYKLGDITIDHPWARPTDKMAKTGAAYFTLKNAGGTPDKLLEVSSERAERVELHRMVNKDGMMTMQHEAAVDLPANGTASLKPGGYHVMFVNLKAPFTEGERFPLQLTFEKAGKVTVQVLVERPNAGKDAPKPMESMEHDHSKMKH